jgi:dihydrodipicolinate synthase/N-acetylneuraminate lyase
VAIYQLPQVTQNEIAPDTLSLLAGKYPNFYLFKDTSGTDRALLSGLDFGGVFFLRGMEGAYFDWFAGSKTRYPGFLLSSANCFASTLMRMLTSVRAGDVILARSCSDQVQGMIEAVLNNTASLTGGNVFANTNKCFEHCLAYGPQWNKTPLPMRHCGEIIPESYVAFAAQILEKFGFMPDKGYLQK